ncbi:chlorinating enzyme [Actinocorallia sp. API 0066]|uniref:chlorinating enzyme n=1 Tax=Actinocorallia sp. API 0066 TaxID=2896846 RepID=UPI001E2ABFC5|nr:chlorinating enzyme [Actinocorallia sp. API 0066]MCD0453403.1 chlorinating enzyme [Actinocorallia sp. API 0066]
MTETKAMGLTDEQVAFFRENGFVGPFDLYSEEEAPLLWNQAKIEMVLSQNKPHNSTIINYDRHLDCNTLSDHVSRPEIVNRLRSLIGDDILCWKTNIFQKVPGEAGTGWHQVETFVVGDTTTASTPSLKYTEESSYLTQELTVWTAFSPAGRENGCLRFIPGSHKRWYYDESKPLTLNVESKTHDFFGYDYAELKLDKDWDPEGEQIFEMEMKAGQFVIFLAKCIHGSLPNVSEETRLAYASRYVAPSVKVYENVDSLSEFGDTISLDYHGSVLVSGEDTYGYNRIHDHNLNGHPFRKVTD